MYNDPTIQDFEQYFSRDFPYGTNYLFSVSAASAYPGDLYTDGTGATYTVLAPSLLSSFLLTSGPNSAPSPSGTLSLITGSGDSSIPYTSVAVPSSPLPATVTGVDINKALGTQQNNINQCLFPNQNIYTTGALLLSAHFLVLNLRASSQGIAGQWDWLNASKRAGNVSATFDIPDRLLENPELAILASTTYGTQFLYLVLPYLTGQMFPVQGGTVVGPGNGGLFGAVGPWNQGG